MTQRRDTQMYEYVEAIGRDLYGKAGRFTLGMVCSDLAPLTEKRADPDRTLTNKLYWNECRQRSWPALQNIHGDMRRFERVGMVARIDADDLRELKWLIEPHPMWESFFFARLHVLRYAEETLKVQRDKEREERRAAMLTGLTGMLERVRED